MTSRPASSVLQNARDPRLSLCVFDDGTRMENPIRQIIEKLGWFKNPSYTEYDLAIYGAGPAALSAAVYGASEGLKTVVVERYAIGGQAAAAPRSKTILVFPPASAAWNSPNARASGLPFRCRNTACPRRCACGVLRRLADGTKLVSRAAICATGIEYYRLGLPNGRPISWQRFVLRSRRQRGRPLRERARVRRGRPPTPPVRPPWRFPG
jgi:thioredoxin reductase (NADPH)